jgi:hypothetical protein
MKKAIQKFIPIKKMDADRQIVFGEVYAPYEIDSHGDMMTEKSIEQLAYRFMRKTDLSKVIDVQHNRKPIAAYPVESFIARGNPDYTEGAWVLAVKIDDKDIWAKIKNNELNGYSFDAFGLVKEAVTQIEFYKISYGMVESSENHTHAYFIEFDSVGQILKGRTSIVNGHWHDIEKGTATEKAANHAHRMFLED